MRTIPRTARLWPIVLILAAVVLTACNVPARREVATPSATNTPASDSEMTPVPIAVIPTAETEVEAAFPQPTRVMTTGILEIDRAVAIILSNNLEARRDLVHFSKSGCTHELGMGGPPKCEPGQAEGTPVEHFPILGPGEGQHIRPESIAGTLEFDAERLYAVYRRTGQPVLDSYFPSGEFGLIFEIRQEAIVSHVLAHLDEAGRLVRLDFEAWPPGSTIEQEFGEWLVAPPQSSLSGITLVNPTPTPTPFAGEGPGEILSFSVTSDMERPGPGDEVLLKWQTAGGQAGICVSYAGLPNDDCFDVSPTGEQSYALRSQDPVADHWAEFVLEVRDGYSGDHQEIFLPVKCHYEWFRDDLSDWCPYGPTGNVSGTPVFQAFEGGLAISHGSMSRVIFDEPGEPCRDYKIGSNTAMDVELPEAPAGRYLPGREMALLWQGELPGTEGLRERLGWATSPPESYTMHNQCERTPGGLGSCFVSLPDGRIFSPEIVPWTPEREGVSFSEGTCRSVSASDLAAQGRPSEMTLSEPALSSLLDSRHLSFIRGGKLWLWQDGVEIPLSEDNSAQSVRISDDGHFIATKRWGKVDVGDGVTLLAPIELWLIRQDGRDERLLIGPDELKTIAPGDEELAVKSFDWIPGTHTLLFNTIPGADFQEPTDDLHLVNVDTGELKTLLPAGEGGDFLVSPNGRSIAITSQTRISLLNLQQGEARTLLTYPKVTLPGCGWFYPSPRWAADSRSLSVAIPGPDLRDNTTITLWRLPVDGTPPAVASEFSLEPRVWPLEGMISPDLAWVAFQGITHSGGRELHIARTDGTARFLVSGLAEGEITSIKWAPESDYLAVGMRRPSNTLYLVQIGNDVAIRVPGAISEDVSWIDSSHFFYHGGSHNHPVLSVGSVDGGSAGVIEFDNDPNALTRFIVYDFTR
jgi:hypothetical protein